MNITMTDDTAQGIYWELHYILNPEWTITNLVDGFRVAPPLNEASDGRLDTTIFGEVWRISGFVAYQHFSCISKVDNGYMLESIRENGTGYRIIFDATSNGLPNHRPTPLVE